MVAPALPSRAYLLVYHARPFDTGKTEFATGVLSARCPSRNESLPRGGRASAREGSFRDRSTVVVISVGRAGMAEAVHPAATHHLPPFFTAPGETDVLMVITAVILGLSVFAFGVFFFRLHSLPEHIAHKSHKMQAEFVAVLCLISLFTHMHIFWIAGLVIAMIELPDFGTPLNRIAGSAEKLAGLNPGEGVRDAPRDAATYARNAGESADAPPGTDAAIEQADGTIPLPPSKSRERAHA